MKLQGCAGLWIAICLSAIFICGCATTRTASTSLFIEDSNLQQRITNEQEGSYFVGRRLGATCENRVSPGSGPGS
jgi:hypothetical protein